MAKFWFNPADYSIGDGIDVLPLRFEGDVNAFLSRPDLGEPEIVAEPLGPDGKAFQVAGPENAEETALIFEDPGGSLVEAEVYVAYVPTSVDNTKTARPAIAITTDAVDPTLLDYYNGGIRPQGGGWKIQLRRYEDSVVTAFSPIIDYTPPASVVVNYARMRAEIEGGGVRLYNRVWDDGHGAEPAAWDQDWLSSVTLSAGWAGIASEYLGGVKIIGLGVGTDGDAAPTAPVSGGTEYTHSISGSCTASASISRSILSSVSGQISAAGSAAKGIVLGAAYAGSITATGSLSKSLVFLQSVVGSVTSAGTVAKSVLKNLAGVVTASSAINKAISITKVGSVTATGTLTKAYTTIQSIAGQITASSTLATLKGVAVFITTRVRKLFYNYIGRR